MNRLRELEDMPPMVTSDNQNNSAVVSDGEIKLNGDSFEFEESNEPILDNLSVEIEPGSTVAFVGRVGSGKSWLVNLIPRLVDPTGGSVKLDGHDLKQFNLKDLRRNIGYVPQEPVLFSDSIKNNILFGRDDISDDTVDWAIEIAQLKTEMESFPDGLDTEIGVRGMSISGGQKQRLALARALVGKPKILILDDCTSALDSSTEAALWSGLHKVMPDLTALLITHRPDTLEKVDKIVVLKRGRIVETGKHHELINNGGEYSSIYRRYRLEEEVS